MPTSFDPEKDIPGLTTFTRDQGEERAKAFGEIINSLMDARHPQRNDIARAVAAIQQPGDGNSEFAIRNIEIWLNLLPRKQPPGGSSARHASNQLRRFAAALRDIRAITSNLDRQAFDALNFERQRRGLVWVSSFLSPSEFIDYLDYHYPELSEAADAAAKAIEKQIGPGRPSGRNEQLIEFVKSLAGIYEILTGKAAQISGGESKFSQFVADIFAIAGIPEESVQHYARIGANRYRSQEPPQSSAPLSPRKAVRKTPRN